MRANRKAQILTVAVLLLAIGAGWARKSGWRLLRAAPTPEDTIHAMLNAARAGKVKEYLDAYTNPMKSTLQQTIAESSQAAFAQYLVNTSSAIKGVATFDPEKISETETKVRVEYVFDNRNEAQTMYLEKLPAGWKIARTDANERVPTLVPYGTPVK